MKLISVAFLCTTLLTIPSYSQNPQTPPPALAKTADVNMQILLDKVKADKKLVVAANMDLTDAEAAKFWPIYDMYQNDLKVLNDRLTAAIYSYADAYNKNTLTDAQAAKLTDDLLTIDQDEVAMRKRYAATLATVLPGKKAARYLQIENKIRMFLRSEIADDIPVVP